MKTSIKCPCCESSAIKLIGRIPDVDVFSGRVLSSVLKGHHLYSCNKCNFWFRYPRMQKNKMDDLYRSGDETAWAPIEGKKRIDWDIASRWVNSSGSRKKVLDVGCFSGDFLKSIENDATLYGIEIHQKAANRAKQYGVNILGDDFSVLELIDGRFDVITSFDVIEHVYNPKSFLRKLANVTKPHGEVIISTGNTMALSWRLMKSRYWYCANAEHISFISPKWCQAVARDCGLQVEKVEFFSHAEGGGRSIFNIIKETIFNLTYRFLPFVFHYLRKRGFGGKEIEKFPELLDYPPFWMTAKDHFIVRLRKCDETTRAQS